MNYVLPVETGAVSGGHNGKKAAVVAHIYYNELISYCWEYLSQIPESIDLVITTDCEEKKALHKKMESVYYPSDQAGFPVSVAVAALKRKKCIGYYMDKIHTKHDTVFMKENIQYLVNTTRHLVKQL